MVLLIIGCGTNDTYLPSQPQQQEPVYNYEKTFWVGIDSGTREYKIQLCNQRFAETYGNSNVECNVRNEAINVDNSGEGKSGSIECVCKY